MKKIQEILGRMLGPLLSFLIVFAVFGAIALISGNIMALFGFRYRSVGQLLLFFLLAEVVSFPMELLSQGVPRALYGLKYADRRQANLLYVPLDAMCSYFAFWIADQLMSGVSATGLSLWVVSLWMAVTTLPIKKQDEPPK